MNIDTNNSLVNAFSERMVQIIAALPKHAIADTEAKGLIMGDVIQALRVESGHERYQRPIRSFYDLSTAHVSPDARRWLETQAYANALQQAGTFPWSVAALMFGWIMYVPTADRMVDDSPVHPDLRDACVEARMCGCDYIMFDADAPTIGSLPVYEEDETSTEGLSEEEQKALAAVPKQTPAEIIRESLVRTDAKVIHPEDGMPMDDPGKPADRRVLLDDESPTFGRARAAAKAAGKAALDE